MPTPTTFLGILTGKIATKDTILIRLRRRPRATNAVHKTILGPKPRSLLQASSRTVCYPLYSASNLARLLIISYPLGHSNPHKRSDEYKPDNLGHPAGQKQNGMSRLGFFPFSLIAYLALGPPSPRKRSGEADSLDVREHGKNEPHVNQIRGQPLTPNHGGKGGHEGPHQRSTNNTTPNGDAGSYHGHGSPINDGGSPAYYGRDVSATLPTGEHEPFAPGPHVNSISARRDVGELS
jgi:hypothetical protein